MAARIVIALDGFKGSITAARACACLGRAIQSASPDAQIELCPVADGGEGTAAAFLTACGGARVPAQVEDALGRRVHASWVALADGNTALIELASASGIERLSIDELNPMQASSFGTGQLIRAALDAGRRRILLGLGGSATVDGGAGIFEALGCRLLDAAGVRLSRGASGLGDLATIDRAELHPALSAAELQVICDVGNPLTGPNGAAAVFGPQKGCGTDEVRALDRGLARFAQILERTFSVSLLNRPGVGAAGGAAIPFICFGHAELLPGAQHVLGLLRFAERLTQADLVITGEGRLDAQTASGKAPLAVAEAAAGASVPLVAVVGSLAEPLDAGMRERFLAIYELSALAGASARALRDPEPWLTEAGRRIVSNQLAEFERSGEQ